MQRTSRRLPRLPLPEAAAARRSSYRSALFVIVLLGLTSGLVGGTGAIFNATTTNPGFIATPSLAGPNVALTATVAAGSGNNAVLTWPAAGNLAPGNEYQAYRATNLVTAAGACPTNGGGTGDTNYTGANGTSVGFTNLLTLTDAGVSGISTATTSDFLCYMLFGAYTSGVVPSAPTWISHPIAAPFNPTAKVHLPLVATAVVWKDSVGGVCGATCTIDTGDKIQITYNQPTTSPAIGAPNHVCVLANGKILIGASVAGGNCGAASAQVGEIDPPAGCTVACFDTGGQDDDYNATYAWNPAGGCPVIGGPFTAGTVLCVTIGAFNNGQNVVVKNTGWSFVPATSNVIQSNDALPANRVSVCTTGVQCRPTTATQP
jgi:hypothetical protein